MEGISAIHVAHLVNQKCTKTIFPFNSSIVNLLSSNLFNSTFGNAHPFKSESIFELIVSAESVDVMPRAFNFSHSATSRSLQSLKHWLCACISKILRTNKRIEGIFNF